MAARSVAVALLFVALAVAGCIGGKPPAKEQTASIANKTNATCFDGSCKALIAYIETNKTEMGSGGMAHAHDLWKGRERVNLFTQTATMAVLGTGNAANYEAEAQFHPAQNTLDPNIVYEGTDHVEFTISNPQRHACAGGYLNGYPICDDTVGNITGAPTQPPAAPDPTGGPTGLKLRYRHALTTNWIDVGPIGWNVPVSIKITDPKQVDMPHSASSGWSFSVVSPDRQDSTLEFTAKADLIRGPGAIPVWPGHPNFYADVHARRVLDADAIACDTNTCALPDYAKAGPIKAEKLISYGTKTIFVWINITNVFETNPATGVDNWFLWHYNTTGDGNVTNVFDQTKHGRQTMSHEWVLPVDEPGMDSPYGDASKWLFQLGGAFYKKGISCYGGCADWGAKYHITIVATDEAMAWKDYDWACLGSNYCPKDPNATGLEVGPVTLVPTTAPDAPPGAIMARFE